MELVPYVPDDSLQIVLNCAMMADRNLYIMEETLKAMEEVKNDLKDQDSAPAALVSIRLTIRSLHRTLYHLSIWRLQMMSELQRSLNAHFQQYGRAPLIDLEL